MLTMCLLFVDVNAQELDANAILRRHLIEMTSHKSIKYNIHYRMKYASRDDTAEYFATCYLFRDQSDTVIGGKYYVEYYKNGKLNGRRAYSNNTSFFINDSARKVEAFRSPEDRDPLHGNTADYVILERFFRDTVWMNPLDSSYKHTILNDTVIGSRPVCHIRTIGTVDQYSSGSITDSYFDKELGIKIGSKYTVEFMGGVQYNYFKLDSVIFDRFDTSMISNNYPKDYSFELFKPKPELPLLTKGTIAPDIVGVRFPTGDTVRLSDYKGKLVLLDFFYTTCFPCIQAIPHLQATYEKYKDSGVVVLGIDPFEKLGKDKKKLTKFFDREKVTYPIILVEESIGDDYHVEGYPTMYIVDKSGKIVHSSVGYGFGAEFIWENQLLKEIRK